VILSSKQIKTDWQKLREEFNKLTRQERLIRLWQAEAKVAILAESQKLPSRVG